MIYIDYKDSRPIYEQVVEKLKNLILKGILEPDAKMPSVRNLAMELSINPNTIQKAYARLEQDGYIYTIKGRGNFVSSDVNLLEDKEIQITGRIMELLKEAEKIGISREAILLRVNEKMKGEKQS